MFLCLVVSAGVCLLVVSAGMWLVVFAGKFRLVLLPDVHEQTLCERSACTVALKRALPMKAIC